MMFNKLDRLTPRVTVIAFIGVLFLQCVIFHYLCFDSVYISSLWKNPLVFWAFYLPKIGISLAIGSVAFIIKNKGWTIVMSILTSLWIIAECIYYRANRIFLDAHSFFLIDNMSGFWSSVPVYFQWLDLIVFLPTLLLILLVCVFRAKYKSYRSAIFAFLLGVVFLVGGLLTIQWKYYKQNGIHDPRGLFYNPFTDLVVGHYFFTKNAYIIDNSVLHALVYDVKSLIELPFESKHYVMSDDELVYAHQFTHTHTHTHTYTQPAKKDNYYFGREFRVVGCYPLYYA